MVENTLKYAGDGVVMHLECYSAIEKFCYLTYYDTGKGVPDDHLEKIFERFYRIDEGRARDVGGSGLGLSIVRNAVKFHGGSIRAINRQWGGLQFFFSLRRQFN
jgi:signal transduction histidine kinase